MNKKKFFPSAWLALVLFAWLPQPFLLADENEAADMYKEAQNLKRQFDYDSARTLFETVTEIQDSGTWGKLASDELRYGLPMFEADQLVIKFGRSSHKPQQQDEYRDKAQELYQQVIDLNADKPERVQAAQRKLDNLITSSSYLKASRDMQLLSALTPMRMELRQRFSMYGKWPEEDWMRTTLETTLARSRLPKDRLVIDEYWVDGENFRLQLNGSDGNQLKMIGDANGVRVE